MGERTCIQDDVVHRPACTLNCIHKHALVIRLHEFDIQICLIGTLTQTLVDIRKR